MPLPPCSGVWTASACSADFRAGQPLCLSAWLEALPWPPPRGWQLCILFCCAACAWCRPCRLCVCVLGRLACTVHLQVGARARPSNICEFTSEINLEPLISIVNFRLPCLLWCEIGPDIMDFRFRDPTCTIHRAGGGRSRTHPF